MQGCPAAALACGAGVCEVEAWAWVCTPNCQDSDMSSQRAPLYQPRPLSHHTRTGEVVDELERLFNDRPDECGDVFAIPRARIPVIKLLWKPTGTKARAGAVALLNAACA